MAKVDQQGIDKEAGGTKKPFALRINAQTMDLLERWAAEEFRSVNGQIEYILTQAVQKKYGKKRSSSTDVE